MHAMSWQFDMMSNNLIIVKQLITSVSEKSIFQRRDGGNGWTISEVIGHLADYEVTIYQRARLTAESENPMLPSMQPDPDTQVINGDYANQRAEAVLEQWKEKRETYLTYLKSLPEADTYWQRPATHPKRGTLIFKDQLILTTWHDTNHMHQIVKIMNQ